MMNTTLNVRQSNYECLRLVCMLMVMICHANGHVQQGDIMGIEGFCKIAVNQFCFVCVNVFIMISGWFGIKASWKKAGALLFQVAFWGILCFLCAKILGLPVSFQEHLLLPLYTPDGSSGGSGNLRRKGS